MSTLQKPNLIDKIKWKFLLTVAVSGLSNSLSTLIPTKGLVLKLNGNDTKMPWAVLSKCWKQNPTEQEKYGYLIYISQTIQDGLARYVGHCRRSKDKLIINSNLWTPIHGQASVHWGASLAKVPDSDIVVSEFELHLRYYVQFRTITSSEVSKPLPLWGK